ncbi:hypothetical protein, partial [Pontiella sp.]|uniref:hypothetical protein n=1 Tax=Pontiella sp. TaxID=2837462 RepID=UPI003567FFA7
MKWMNVLVMVMLPGLSVMAGERPEPAEPLVLGYGAAHFSIGDELYSTDFSDEENWAVQVSVDDEAYQEKVSFSD